MNCINIGTATKHLTAAFLFMQRGTRVVLLGPEAALCCNPPYYVPSEEMFCGRPWYKTQKPPVQSVQEMLALVLGLFLRVMHLHSAVLSEPTS